MIWRRYSFDIRKDASNLDTHSVSLADAGLLEWAEMLIEVDDRFDYDETRLVGFAPIGRLLYCVVFTERGDACHVISLRKANRKEIDRYEAHIDST